MPTFRPKAMPGSSDQLPRNRDAAPSVRPRPQVRLDSRGIARERKFREAAIAVLLEKGYRNTRLSDIVARAKGSLATLYRIYGDKDGLVHAIMEGSIESFGESLQRLERSTLPAQEALTEAAERMAEDFLSPARIVSHRIAIAEGPSYPALRDWFTEHAVEPPTRALARYLARAHDDGLLHIQGDPYLAAERFYMAVFGQLIIRTTSGLVGPDDVDAERANARAAVAQFCAGINPRP